MAVSGLAISRGVQVSPATGTSYAAAVMIDAANHAKLVPTNWPATSTAAIWAAISGDYPLLIAGVNIGRKFSAARRKLSCLSIMPMDGIARKIGPTKRRTISFTLKLDRAIKAVCRTRTHGIRKIRLSGAQCYSSDGKPTRKSG